jgi:UDP-N-acetylmuramyl pentapeptide synthase
VAGRRIVVLTDMLELGEAPASTPTCHADRRGRHRSGVSAPVR